MDARAQPCPHACPGKRCLLEPVGGGELPQSGDTYLPATRYEREGCPVQIVATLPTGEAWRARA